MSATTEQQPGCLPPGFTRDSFLTIREFCTYQRIHPNTFSVWVKAGKVPGYRVATKRIHVGTFQDFTASNPSPRARKCSAGSRHPLPVA